MKHENGIARIVIYLIICLSLLLFCTPMVGAEPIYTVSRYIATFELVPDDKNKLRDVAVKLEITYDVESGIKDGGFKFIGDLPVKDVQGFHCNGFVYLMNSKTCMYNYIISDPGSRYVSQTYILNDTREIDLAVDHQTVGIIYLNYLSRNCKAHLNFPSLLKRRHIFALGSILHRWSEQHYASRNEIPISLAYESFFPPGTCSENSRPIVQYY